MQLKAKLASGALFICLSTVVMAGGAKAAEIRAAVAANFNAPLAKLAALYKERTGNTVTLSAGSSGALYAQITNGAPFDVFFSADAARPERLEAEGAAVAGSRFTYAVGVLVLWSPITGYVDSEGRVLSERDYRFIAVADPVNAPYGTAAKEVLTKADLWEGLEAEGKLAIGNTIGQTYSHVSSEAAPLGFVALSQVKDPDSGEIRGSYWLPPKNDYTPIRQQVVVLENASDRAAAQAFLDWVKADDEAQAVIRSYGYELE